MRVLTVTFAAGCLMALGACQTTTQDTAPASVSGATLARSPDAGPGENLVGASRAAQYFSALCGQAGSGVGALETAAAKNGFVQNTKLSTYYHAGDNLSVKLFDGNCSMVFASDDAVADLQKALESLDLATGPVRFGTGLRDQRSQYYIARTKI